MGSRINSILREQKEELYLGIILTVAVCFMFFIFSPMELYFTNKGEFWFDMYLLLPVMLVVFIIMSCMSILFLFLVNVLSSKWYHILLVFYFIAFICSYIQGNFLVDNLPPLDGSPIDWSKYPMERVKSIILWIVITGIVLLILKVIKRDKFYRAVKYISVCMTLMLMITLISVCITTKGYEKKANLAVSTKNQFEMSEKQNFIILLLDAADSEEFNKMLETHPEYEEIFEDFTYYRNTMGVYSFTKHSIPFIFSGDWYENDEPYDEYLMNVYKNSDFFSKLEAQSYKLGVYEAEMIPADEDYFRFENVLENEKGVTSYLAFARWQIQMTGFRYAPFDLKRICFVNPEAFKNLKIPPEEYSLFIFATSNEQFYNRIQHDDFSYTSDKCFKFIHLSGAHVPFKYDADMNIIEDATYETNMEASMTITKAYLNKLKEGNVYDNSVIIVMADHGYNVNADPLELYTLDHLWRQNPILFVKGIGEKHEMRTSDAPVSFVDLQEAFSRLLQGTDSSKIFDWQEGDERQRRYLFYYYKDESPMYEYVQTGMAWERDTFKSTGKEYFLGDKNDSNNN